MIPDRKHPSVAFWFVVALAVVLVGYPLSFGPWCWLTANGLVPNSATLMDAHFFVYRPLYMLGEKSKAIEQAMSRYSSLFAPLPEDLGRGGCM